MTNKKLEPVDDDQTDPNTVRVSRFDGAFDDDWIAETDPPADTNRAKNKRSNRKSKSACKTNNG